MKFCNKIYFYINNIYSDIINFYIKNGNRCILIKLKSDIEQLFLCNIITMWILCIKRKNIYPCYECDNCITLKKNTHQNLLNLDNKKYKICNKSILDFFKYNFLNENKIICIYNTDYIFDKTINILLNKIKLKNDNIFFLINCFSLKKNDNLFFNKSYFFSYNYINNIFLFNYIKNNYFIKNLEKKLLIKLGNFSIINIINIFNLDFIKNINLLFNEIKFSLINKNFSNLFKLLSSFNKKKFLFIDIFLYFINDVINFKLNKKCIFNKNNKKIIVNFSCIINFKFLNKILINFIKYKYYINNISYINTDIILIYNLLLINKNLYK